MDEGWEEVATRGISTPFVCNVLKYIGMLATARNGGLAIYITLTKNNERAKFDKIL